jgi:hypothetical protein
MSLGDAGNICGMLVASKKKNYGMPYVRWCPAML